MSTVKPPSTRVRPAGEELSGADRSRAESSEVERSGSGPGVSVASGVRRGLDASWYWLFGIMGVAALASAAGGFWHACYGVLAGIPVAAANHLWMLHAVAHAARIGKAAGLQAILVASLGRMGIGMAALFTVVVVYESAEVLIGVSLSLLADLVVSSRDWSRNRRRA